MELLRLFIFTIKINVRDFGYWFWMLIYPMLMAVLFVVTTNNIMSNSSFDEIVVGIEEENIYYTILSNIEMLDVSQTTEEDARVEIDNEEMTAFIKENGDIIVGSSGIDETIVNSIVNDIHQIVESDVGFQHFDFEQSYIETEDYESEPQIVMFFSLLGMMAFYSLFSVQEFLTKLQPNLSHQGARFYASPISKAQMVLANVIASVLLGLLTNVVVIGFLMIMYQGTLFDQLLPTILLLVVGNIAGAGLGLLIGVLPIKNEGFKTTVGIVVTLFLSFTGGLGGPDLRRIAIESFPWFHRVNPIGQFTDTMYQINYMSNFDSYLPTILLLLSIFVGSVIIAYFVLRRQQYDSI